MSERPLKRVVSPSGLVHYERGSRTLCNHSISGWKKKNAPEKQYCQNCQSLR